MFDPQVDGAALAGCLARYRAAMTALPGARRGTGVPPSWLWPACVALLLLGGVCQWPVLFASPGTSVAWKMMWALAGLVFFIAAAISDAFRREMAPAPPGDVARMAEELALCGLVADNAPRVGQVWSERDLAPWREVLQARKAWFGAAADLGLGASAQKLSWQDLRGHG